MYLNSKLSLSSSLTEQIFKIFVFQLFSLNIQFQKDALYSTLYPGTLDLEPVITWFYISGLGKIKHFRLVPATNYFTEALFTFNKHSLKCALDPEALTPGLTMVEAVEGYDLLLLPASMEDAEADLRPRYQRSNGPAGCTALGATCSRDGLHRVHCVQ